MVPRRLEVSPVSRALRGLPKCLRCPLMADSIDRFPAAGGFAGRAHGAVRFKASLPRAAGGRIKRKDLGDGLVHRVAHEVARAITWDAERTGATGFTSYIAAAAWRFSLPLLNARRRRVRNRLFIRISSACVQAPCSSPGSLGAALLFLCGGRPRGRPLALAMRRLRRRGSFRCNSATLRSEVAN